MIIAILSVITGVFYRVGGTEYGTKWRDLGVPVCVTLAITLTVGFHWTLIASFGLLFASLTTYNKWFGKLIFKRKDNEVHWEGWLITGLFYGLSLLPYIIHTGEWLEFFMRASILSTLTCVLSELIGTAYLEEFCRGFLIIYTLLLII